MSAASDPLAVVLTSVTNRVATVTMNRPESRNALNTELRRSLPRALQAVDGDPDVDVIILTGSDPAFSAGLDLKELGAGENRIDDPDTSDASPTGRGPFPRLNKPLVGAVNGVAITGGFELALNCDFIVASERAAFADTHLVVERIGNAATVRVVAGEERREELSRMLSGLPDSERGREHAGELLALAAGL